MSRVYVTAQGDMWDTIAKRTLGSEYYMTELLEANPQYQHLVIFPANVRMTIPDIPIPEPDNLPPWKRGES